MAINREELLKDVRKIINESILEKPSVYDITKKFNIRRYVTGLIEEGHKNPDLMNMLVKYDKMLNEGVKDFTVYETFGNELAHYASGNKSIKNVIKDMNETLKDNSAELTGFLLIEKITDPYAKEIVSETFTNYVTDRCSDTLNKFIDSLDLVYALDENLAMRLNLLTTQDSGMSNHFIHADFINESAYDTLNRQLQEDREKRQAKEIYEKVEKYLQSQLDAHDKAEAELQETLCLEAIANNNGIELGKHLNDIRNSDAATNERLMLVIEAYDNAVKQGAYEERLYETFIQNVSKFNYLIPVDKAIKSITEKVNANKENIKLTQILEEMKDNQYSFIYVDLIEEDVARYVHEPSDINRVQLRNALAPYAADPYINEMFNVLYNDNTKRDSELVEKALNIKDQINLIRENASVEPIYTPVQYIKENECIFNVNGQYYVKKGNSMSILEEKYTDQLDESFIELCHLVNDPHVEIHENYIEVYGNNNLYAKVFEGYVDVLGIRESRESLRDLRTMCMKHDNYDTNFYVMCSCLHENFNNIAKVDWAKHVTLNSNNNISADLFKLDENIFITTHNDSLRQHTFYRNVNPIFCRNKINEHMGINVSALFTDLLPSQDRIILKLNETKSSYEESISQYEEMIDKLNTALAGASEENKEDLEKAVKDAESKLEDIKTEYKEWQEKAAEATGETEDTEETSSEDTEEVEGEVIKEPSNEPVSDDEVEQNMEDLSSPIGDETVSTDDMSDETVSDDEFEDFLDTDDEDDIMEPEDETEVVVDGAEDEEDFDTDDEEIVSEEPEVEDKEEFAEVNLGDEETEEVEDIVTDDTISDEDVFGDETVDNTEDSLVQIDGEDETAEVVSDETETEYNGHEATDAFGGNTEDPLEQRYEPSDMPENVMKSEEEVAADTMNSDFAYKIANVMFDENVKTGVTQKSGSVIAIIPMVDGTGKKYIENKDITFYIDEDSNVILNNEEMSGDLYNAVINSIKSHPAFMSVCQNGEVHKLDSVPATAVGDSSLSWEEEYMRDGNDEDRGEYSMEPAEDEWSYLDTLIDAKKDDEPTTGVANIPADNSLSQDEVEDFMKDEEASDDETEDIVIPTYKEGDTEVEFPAANVDDTIIPESVNTPKKKSLKESIKVTAVYKKNGKEKRFF